MKRISETARAMSAGDLNARIAVDRTESELEQVASTLNDAFDRLRLAVEQERRFTADASHELRTPISVLRAEAEWALDRERTPQQYRDALSVCRRAALRMQDAVQRMLALVRAEASEELLQTGPVAMHTVAADVLQWLKPLAQERGVRLAADGEPAIVRGDAEQLREALSNIVANAILYNKMGGSVTVWTRQTAGAARIEVADTGIGIPAEAIPHVFDRFYRVDKARSRDAGGSGLGLSIARAIVEAHGGDITCTSEPGTGSVFVISLAHAATPERDRRARASSAGV
jgi:heavy metal sensor kinase